MTKLIKIFLIFVTVTTCLKAISDDRCNNNNVIYNNINVMFTQEFYINMKQSIKEFRDKTSQSIHDAIIILFDVISKNKLKTTFYCLLIAYAYLNYKIVGLQKKLKDPSCWSLWFTAQAPTFDDLLEVSHSSLMESMLQEIQYRYMSPTNPADFITPLIQFISELKTEKALLHQYLRIVKLLNSVHLSALIMINAEILNSVKERIQRLTYLNNIFRNWIAKYNLSRNQIIPHPSPNNP